MTLTSLGGDHSIDENQKTIVAAVPKRRKGPVWSVALAAAANAAPNSSKGRASPDNHDLCANAATKKGKKGQACSENQQLRAPIASQIDSEGHESRGAHWIAANAVNLIDGEGHEIGDAQGDDALTVNPIAESGQSVRDAHNKRAGTCDTIRELHRQRQDLHRAEKSLTLQIKAKCRRLAAGDKTEAEKVYKSMLNGCEHDLAMFALTTTMPFLNARGLLEKERKTVEKQMSTMAKTLPVYPWVESVKGFGALGFAQIVGEAGDLSNYATVSRLWKRMGLAVINGGRQRMVAGPDALEHGYNPSRRSIMWNIGDSMFRSNGPYADLCRERKDYEREKAAAEGLTVCPAAKIPAKQKELYRSDGHVHNRAKRYMEKRLLRDLWRAWRDIGLEGQASFDAHAPCAD
jgi:hypothetical protein